MTEAAESKVQVGTRTSTGALAQHGAVQQRKRPREPGGSAGYADSEQGMGLNGGVYVVGRSAVRELMSTTQPLRRG